MTRAAADGLEVFGSATRSWFTRSFQAPTPVQRAGWRHIAAGEHTLLLAPTGSGKTLAAFLWCIDRLFRTPLDEREGGTRVLYVSPLKALAYDVERNLRAPLVGITHASRERGDGIVPPRVDIRSGDTSQQDRRLQARNPAEILVTTPESLYLVLTSAARETLRSVQAVIVDEVHSLAPTKRGAHLALSLERLAELTGGDPQRVGLSATARPVDVVARYLGGDRPVAVADCTGPPALDLKVMVPVPDMTRPERRRDEPVASAPPVRETHDDDGDDDAPEGGWLDDHPPPPHPEVEARFGPQGAAPQHGIWPVLVPELMALIRAHRTTIVFVNSRAMCERLVQRINELADEGLVRAHHGSLSHAHRREVEDLLKTGGIAGIVATSSLELGIDMGAVDLVILVESPGSVSSGLQRVGRAGHGVGEVSKGRVFPKHRGDLLEATVVARRMREGAIEPLRLPQSPLDVLAQQVVAMCAHESRAVADVERLVRRAASFVELPRRAFTGVLDMLSGRYPSTDFAELRPRLVWDRDGDELTARKGTRMLAVVSGGTIPDRGLYAVHLGAEGPRVGELDEEMVHETQPGHVIILGASSWRVEEITRDRVVVSPAPGEVGRMPFWRGEGPGRPIELGQALGAFLRELDGRAPETITDWLVDEHMLDPLAAENLLRHVAEQKEQTGTLPTDRAITVERFRDELGDHRICILTPFGARVHAPWALALQAALAPHGFELQTLYTDDGICLRIADAEEVPALADLLPDPDAVEDLVLDNLGASAMFASRFRENAARALLLPRRRPGSRTPLWQQRLRAQKLLAVARSFPSFPIVVETYRECLQDVFDMPALVELLRRIRSRQIHVVETTTATASPFARSLVFAFVAQYLYEGDAPVAERRAQALSLDRELLRELLGEEELRELLDPEVISELHDELQQLAPDRRARDLDDVHDMLRRLGALSREEIAARTLADPSPWTSELIESRRVVAITFGGVERLAAIEDAGLYRDALGAVPPHGVPEAHLTPVPRALEALLRRHARTRGPFTGASVADRLGLVRAAVEPVLAQLEADGQLVRGSFAGHRSEGPEWCDTEVLRRIKRRTLARLRGEVEPVDRVTFARFLPAWHGLIAPRRGLDRLEEVLVQLEGMPLSYAELERAILPARVRDFSPRMLDELGAMGVVVWVGCGALGVSDARVALLRRARVAKLLEPPVVPGDLSAAAANILARLGERGACFFAELGGDGDATADELTEALWDLVCAGLVTNDTFQPLRALGMRRSKSVPGRRRGSDLRTAGRWSLVSHLLPATEPDNRAATERAHARAVMLLERHGIVSREAATLEALPGGFSGIYPVLRSMEEAGKVRRGYFVEGIGGSQFAFAGAVDRLRALRRPSREPQVLLLSAADPANPYGWILPWPALTAAEAHRPTRASGATLVLVDGEPVAFLDRGKAMLTFAGAGAEALERGLTALLETLAARGRRAARIDHIDGQPALRSDHADTLKRLGATFDHRGLIIERRV